MALHFNSLLEQAGVNPSDVRLLRHADTSAQRGRTPFEMWRDDREAFDLYQSIQSVRNRSRFERAPYWAAFGATIQGETVFLGLYSARRLGVLQHDLPRPHNDGVDRAEENDQYSLELSPLLSEFAGRLYIDWGDGKLAWNQRAAVQNKMVLELRRDIADPPFPGYMNFIEPLSRLEAIPSAWQAALCNAKGIYLLSCPRTREQYVGKADDIDGFLGRWRDYMANSHGGNVALPRREPRAYQVSILETAVLQPRLRKFSKWKSVGSEICRARPWV